MQDITNSEQPQSDFDLLIQLIDQIEYDSANYAKSTNKTLKNYNEDLSLFQKQTTRDIDMIRNIQNRHHAEIKQLQMTVKRLSNELNVIRKSKYT